MITAVLHIKEKDRKRDGKGNPDKGTLALCLAAYPTSGGTFHGRALDISTRWLTEEAPAPTGGIMCRHVPYFALVCALAQVLGIRTSNPVSALPRQNCESDGDKAI